jgi:hypothetical protein
MKTKLDEMVAELAPYMQEYRNRWQFIPSMNTTWSSNIDYMKKWIDDRPHYMRQQLTQIPGKKAYWKLDETDGTIAYDSSVNHKDGTLHGEPVWRPNNGIVNGALEFDGIDDWIDTPTILNANEGPFSVFAWIKGGAPGQVILSQEAGANWLLVDERGYLMTSLISGGRRPGDPLVSEVYVTDDSWHRVGLVWNGENRSIFVDDIIVATDTQLFFPDYARGFYIGVDKDRTVGTFWTGLIDDVSIYDQAVIP